LGQVSPEADKIPDSADDGTKPKHRIDATFTDTLVQGERDGMPGYEWLRAERVRLNISIITDSKISHSD
jgi:hypothetical protein